MRKSIGARNPKVWCSFPQGDSKFFSLSHARDKTKNIFPYFFAELKTNHLSYSKYHINAILFYFSLLSTLLIYIYIYLTILSFINFSPNTQSLIRKREFCARARMICNSAEDVEDEPALPAFESEEIWVQIKKIVESNYFESNRYWHGPNANDYSVGPGRVVSKWG